ncbi:MAG: IS1 family transposase [Caldilineaceae bacterium]|nr:IS1 family transposase [Caldilineaceae bacterium]
MNPQEQFCHNEACHASGQVGQGNIVVHSQKEQRYRCKCCGKTFGERKGTALAGIKKASDLFVVVITLLSYGCPVQAIVVAFTLDERTVRSWLLKAGQHSEAVHEHLVGGSQLDLEQVQADEIKGKGQSGSFWLAMAMMVPTRLWLGGAISPKRDKALIQTLVAQIRQVALCRPLLLAVDGLAAYVSVFQETFRTPLRLGDPGRPQLIAWPNINIVQVVKKRSAGLFAIQRRIVQGTSEQVTQLLHKAKAAGSSIRLILSASMRPFANEFTRWRDAPVRWLALSKPCTPVCSYSAALTTFAPNMIPCAYHSWLAPTHKSIGFTAHQRWLPA